MSFHNIFDRTEPTAGRDLMDDYAQPGTGPRASSSAYMPATYRGPSGGGAPSPGVGFVEAIKLVYSKYAQFSGRASRSEFWWVVLFFFATSFVLTLIS